MSPAETDEKQSTAPVRAAVRVVPYGPEALEALADAVAEAKGADLLAPVTVAMPSTHAAVTVRRRLAAGLDGRALGLINVAFVSLPQAVEMLAAPSLAADGRPPLSPIVRTALVRAALAEVPGSLLGPGSSTERGLDATFAELRDLPEPALDQLAVCSARAAEVVARYRRYRELTAAFADEHDTIEAATLAVRAGTAQLATVGALVVHLPRRLRPAEIDLLEALHHHGLVTVLVGTTGRADADATLPTIRARLEGALGPADRLSERASPWPSLRLVRAPDPDEEVAEAVRVVLDALADHPAERLAVVSRLAEPYHLLVHEHLAAAGVPHHGPGPNTLAQSVAGRVLLGLLALPERDHHRADVFRWLRSGPIRGADGPLPLRRFDRLAREAGVSGGAEGWHDRLDRLTDKRRAEGADAEAQGDEDTVAKRRRTVDDLEALRAFFDEVLQSSTPPAGADWAELAAWARRALDRWLGTPGHLAHGSRWPEGELRAFETIHGVLDEIATLRDLPPAADPSLFRRLLADELDRPAGSVGTYGRGVFVGRLADLSAADHDLVVVLGLGEGIYPPRSSDDALLPDHERHAAGDHLPPRRTARGEEARDHFAALASAPTVVLSFPRADTRAERERLPAPWFLEALVQATGGDTTADTLGRVAHEAFVDLPSFEASPADGRTARTAIEDRVSRLLGARASGGPAAAQAITEVDPRLSRGVEAVRSRQEGRFDEWTGRIGPGFKMVSGPPDSSPAASATTLEPWAVCPFRYFLKSVLGIRPLDEKADADSIDARDRGSLVHEVLEKFVGADLERPLSAPFGPTDLDRLRALAAEVGDRYRDEGRTGRPLLWRLQAEALARRLLSITERDEWFRSEDGVVPVAVEFHFGRPDDDVPPVVFALDAERVVGFRGSVDRVDRTPAGDRLVVLDYKTGSANGYKDLKGKSKRPDIVCRGQHLQLVIYAEAARLAHGDLPVSAFYWFVEQSGTDSRLGGAIDGAALDRFRSVLRVMVDGIEEGSFPARPGEADRGSFKNCTYCDFTSVCPSSRDDLWEKVRLAPSLTAYTELAEGVWPPVVSEADDVGAGP